MSLADRVASAPRRRITGRFWHQGPTRHDLLSCADPARTDGRYHQHGGSGVWYGSDQEQAAWAELFRHFVAEGVDPFEVRRRIGRVRVDLELLDLTDERVRAHLHISQDDLVGDDYAVSQEIARAAETPGSRASSLHRLRSMVVGPSWSSRRRSDRSTPSDPSSDSLRPGWLT